MLNVAKTLIITDILSLKNDRHTYLTPVLFLLLGVSVFGFVIEQYDLDVVIAPAIIWLAVLLSVMLSLATFLHLDHFTGNIEQLCISPYPLWIVCLCKGIVHWIFSCLPIILATPFVSQMLGLDFMQGLVCALSVLLGSPVLTFVGLIGGALLLNLPRANLLLCLILFPMYIPVLIFGQSLVATYILGLCILPQVLLLAGFSLLALALCPMAIASALRVGV